MATDASAEELTGARLGGEGTGRPEPSEPIVSAGTVLCAGAVPAARFLLREQFLLQSVLLVVEQAALTRTLTQTRNPNP